MEKTKKTKSSWIVDKNDKLSKKEHHLVPYTLKTQLRNPILRLIMKTKYFNSTCLVSLTYHCPEWRGWSINITKQSLHLERKDKVHFTPTRVPDLPCPLACPWSAFYWEISSTCRRRFLQRRICSSQVFFFTSQLPCPITINIVLRSGLMAGLIQN